MRKSLLTLAVIVLITIVYMQAQPAVQVYGYDGCDQSMTTNHFWINPQEQVSVQLDFSNCLPEDFGQLLVFGYRTTEHRSRQFTVKDKMYLCVDDGVSEECSFDSLLTSVERGIVEYSATNMHKNKAIKVRLRSVLLDP